MKYWRAFDVSNDCVIYIPQHHAVVQPITSQHRDMLRQRANEEGQKVQDLKEGRNSPIPDFVRNIMPDEIVGQLTSQAAQMADVNYTKQVENLEKALRATVLFRTPDEVTWCKDAELVDEQDLLDDLIPHDIDDYVEGIIKE